MILRSRRASSQFSIDPSGHAVCILRHLCRICLLRYAGGRVVVTTNQVTLGTVGLVPRRDVDGWTDRNGNATVCRHINGTVMTTRELGVIKIE